ncbi:hypothetical protein ACFPER_15430 [Agromyces aurantiacus]|uniref:ATPase n=1 Tax=Agromyces aurantiacus TaxID=165814 RepID=A0ABV9R905_9MICO|nr:hypothetical protein [Agromyces aurantiacus]MBM7504916.1 hypothetical protein [Agromyces aurantiacus]
MKSILWFAVGVATGFAVAHQVNRTAQGREFFAGLDAKARAFGRAVAEGYSAREAELRAAEAQPVEGR